MAKAQPRQDLLFHDETVAIPLGEVGYRIEVDDDEAEALAAGRVPDRVRLAFEQMTGWKRPAADDPFFNPTARTAQTIVNEAALRAKEHV